MARTDARVRRPQQLQWSVGGWPPREAIRIGIHCLEALKGDGSHGTTWHGLIARDGQRFDMLPDFTARMKQRVERTEDGGFRILATHPEGLGKIEKQLAKVSDFTGSFTIMRSDNFRPDCRATGPAMRGILKARAPLRRDAEPERNGGQIRSGVARQCAVQRHNSG